MFPHKTIVFNCELPALRIFTLEKKLTPSALISLGDTSSDRQTWSTISPNRNATLVISAAMTGSNSGLGESAMAAPESKPGPRPMSTVFSARKSYSSG